jgi:cytoskeletal protein RodZ
MCFPGAAAVIGVAQAVVGFAGQEQQYQEEEARYNQNYQNALQDNRTAEARLQAKTMEQNQEYSQKAQMVQVEGAQKQATVAAAAATSGVSGNSVQEITNSVGEQINQKQADLQLQWQANVNQTASEKASAVDQENSRIGEVANPYSPSPAGALLSAAGAGLKFAGSSGGQSLFGTAPSDTSGNDGAGMSVDFSQGP